MSLQKTPLNNTPHQPQEVEIIFTEQDIINKLNAYALKPEMVFSKLRINNGALKKAFNLGNLDSKTDHHNTYLLALHDALKNWQPSQNLNIFCTQINQLIFYWLNAMQDGASTQQVLSLVKSFELKSLFNETSTAKFHCFLLDLVTETSQKHQLLHLDYILNFDANTQLPNDNLIPQVIIQVADASPDKQLISFFSIHFQLSKNNPIYSQSMTVSLSKKISQLLQENITSNCHLFYGGNLQFDILAPHLSSEIQINLLVAKLQRAFEQLQLIDSESVLITPFIGCAACAKSATETFNLFGNARLALESALTIKQSFMMYSEDLKAALYTQKVLEDKILDAFNNDNLTLYFQPVVNLNDSSCAGAELLLRWPSAETNIYPSTIIEVLNKLGKGKLFTRWLLNSACRYAADLKYEQGFNLYLTINLRAEDLYDIELPHMLLQAVALWKIEPKNIILEVTENGVLEINETTNSVITMLSQSGFKLALDDFGTGFSSLSRLRIMPIDIIKIDQSFVRDITNSKNDYAIVESIAALANSLGKEVIAEGVEDKACLDLIKKMKIHKCQGYYFAKPMPFEHFIDWVKSKQAIKH